MSNLVLKTPTMKNCEMVTRLPSKYMPIILYYLWKNDKNTTFLFAMSKKKKSFFMIEAKKCAKA